MYFKCDSYRPNFLDCGWQPHLASHTWVWWGCKKKDWHQKLAQTQLCNKSEALLAMLAHVPSCNSTAALVPTHSTHGMPSLSSAHTAHTACPACTHGTHGMPRTASNSSPFSFYAKCQVWASLSNLYSHFFFVLKIRNSQHTFTTWSEIYKMTLPLSQTAVVGRKPIKPHWWIQTPRLQPFGTPRRALQMCKLPRLAEMWL